MQVNDCDLPGTLDGQLGIEMTVDSSENYQLLHSAIRWGDAEVLFDAAFCGLTSITRWRVLVPGRRGTQGTLIRSRYYLSGLPESSRHITAWLLACHSLPRITTQTQLTGIVFHSRALLLLHKTY